MKLSIASLVLLLTAGSASAQQVTFRGKVEDVSGTTNQFVVDCTNTSLTSAAFNLNLFIGQQVEITGQWNGSAANPSVSVGAIQAVPEVFEIGGGAKIGDTSSLSFTTQPGTTVFGFLALAPGFLPFGPDSVILLDTSQVVLTRSGLVGGTGILELPFFVPNSPTLVGIDLFGQGATLEAGGFVVTNPDCKTIDE